MLPLNSTTLCFYLLALDTSLVLDGVSFHAVSDLGGFSRRVEGTVQDRDRATWCLCSSSRVSSGLLYFSFDGLKEYNMGEGVESQGAVMSGRC